jgi:hypothetical protein
MMVGPSGLEVTGYLTLLSENMVAQEQIVATETSISAIMFSFSLCNSIMKVPNTQLDIKIVKNNKA